ncbi:MAG: hypothetical protein Q9220_004660 [cf. Caloplaca sp. 1 TL-2023]
MDDLSGARALHNEPREPPERPGPLDFPHYQVQGDLDAARENARDLASLFIGLEKDVSSKHIEALNITLLGEVPLDRIVPSEHLPPRSWLEDPPNDNESIARVASSAPQPTRKDFHSRTRELLYQTEHAFTCLPSGRRPGQNPPSLRLSHSFKFYQSLLDMAEFWDTSQDKYIPGSGDDEAAETYTGRRYGCGNQMPAQLREDAITAFLEICIWPFQCTIQKPWHAVSRKLQFQNNRYFTIPGVMSCACRNPTDRQRSRQGILEGPLLGIQCRNTTTFRTANESVGCGKEELMDLLFEIGAALLLAQKRAREGKKEQNERMRGEDMFWINQQRRHLGEVGGGKQDRETNARALREISGDAMDGVEMGIDQQKAGSEDRGNKGSSGDKASSGTKKRKHKPPTQASLNLRPPELFWESRMEYEAIGKRTDSESDDVFLVSALNHHVSILHVRVPGAYLDYITYGNGNGTRSGRSKSNDQAQQLDPSKEEWWILEVKRSKWYDLLVPEDRAEAMRGVWGVIAWLTR